MRPLARRNVGAESNNRVTAWLALRVPCATPPDRHLELDGRLEPIHVRTVEQSHFDQAHGGRQDTNATRGSSRCTAAPRPRGPAAPRRVATASADRLMTWVPST